MSARDLAVRRFYPWLGRYRRDVAEPFESIHLRDAFVAGWVAGGAYAMKTSARLVELVPTIELFVDLLAAELDARTNEADPVIETGPAFAAPLEEKRAPTE